MTDPTNHPTDEELVTCLEGEAGAPEQGRWRAHAESCPECRERLRKIQAAWAGVESLRGEWAASEASVPAGSGRRLEAKLRQVERSGAWRYRVAHLFVRPVGVAGFAPRLAAGVAVVLAIGFWYSARRVETVSASELLRQVESRQTADLAGIQDPVIYRALEVRQGVAGDYRQTARLEYWTNTRAGASHQGGDQALWAEIQKIFAANRMAGTPPVSAGSYRSWREAETGVRETVVRQRWIDGTESLALRGAITGGGRPNEIVENELVVRADDWHPVRQKLLVRGVADETEYELTETAFDVVPMATLPPDILAGVTGREISETVGLAPRPGERERTPPPLPVAPGAAAEMKVRYQLHLAGACRGELVRVIPFADGVIRVRGVVDTSQRRDELVAALGQLGTGSPADVDIRSVEGASRPEELFEVLRGLQLGPSLAPPPGSKNAGRRTADPGNQALTAVEAAMADAGALRRLADRYDRQTQRKLDPASKTLLMTMLRSHATALRRNIANNRKLLVPLLKPAIEATPAKRGEPGPADWRGWVRRQFTTVEQLHQLELKLFTAAEPMAGESGPGQALSAEMRRRLRESISAAARDAVALEAAVAPKMTASNPTASRAAGRE